MRWLSNVRLPQAQRCSHGANQRWRIGLDEGDLISLVEPLPAGSRAAGDDWHGDWLSPAGVDLQRGTLDEDLGAAREAQVAKTDHVRIHGRWLFPWPRIEVKALFYAPAQPKPETRIRKPHA